MKRSPIYLSVALLLGAVITMPAQASGPYDAPSVLFAQMMIPHHQQAVLISKLELKQGSNPAVKKLATRIIAEQSPEIAQMKRWIPSNAMAGMVMSMPGLVNPSGLAKLRAAQGKNFDALYLADMTSHHKAAITMATPLIKSMNAEVATLAKNIVAGQSAEIKEMHRIMVTGK